MPNTKKMGPKQGFRPVLAGATMILLTGPSGSGKTTLSMALAKRGWKRIDGDALARSLYVPGSALMKELLRVFGRGILQVDGSLNSVRLGEIVFPSLAQRKRLNAIVYPRFLRALKKAMDAARRQDRRLVADVAIYFDAGAPDLGAPVVLVDAPLSLRIQRLRSRGLAPARARSQARAMTFGPVQRGQASLVLNGRLPQAELLRTLQSHLKPITS